MIPVQVIDIHTDKAVFYKLHLVRPSEGSAFSIERSDVPFSVEVLVYDSEFKPAYSSAIAFAQQFPKADAAFEHGLRWVIGHSNAYNYTIDRINNLCNCELLGKADQAVVLARLGVSPIHQVNGA